MTPLTTKELVAQIREILRDETENGNRLTDGGLAKLLEGTHPADIAEVMESLGDEFALRVFQVLDDVRAAETLDELDSDTASYLLDNDVPGRITTLLDILPMDDAAEVLEESATPERQEEILAELAVRNPEDAAEVRELLSYPAKSAGRLMTDAFVRLKPDMSVDDAFTAIRNSDPDVETLNDLYVVEPVPGGKEEKLIGVLSLRDLVRAHPQARLRAIMVPESRIVTVSVTTDQEEVARLISRYDFLAMPVIDDAGYLAGIVTVDDVVDILVEEQTEDVYKQSGISAEPGVINQPYFTIPVWRTVRSRISWLVLLFVTESMTTGVLEHFMGEFKNLPLLSVFVPLLIGTGGNTGAQTVSTIIRGLSLGEIGLRDAGRVLWREAGAGIMLGFCLGLIGFGRALWVSKMRWDVAAVVALTLLAVCLWANVIGSMIPILAKKLKIDPALVSAPLITTLVDATGLAIYFTIARLLIAGIK